MSEFDMKRTGCTFNPMSADYRVGYESGARYQQVKIDAITKQRDSFIKAYHIAMNDVCEHKAKIDELQSRVDEALNMLCKLQHSSSERIYNDVGNILKGK